MKKKKTIILSVLTASVLCAQDSIKLDDMTISSVTKTQKTIDGVTASVDIITQADIEKMGAESLKDVLKRASGLNIEYGTFPNAASKSKSSISIRGLGAKGTLFLLDGRRLSGEVSNPYDLDRIATSQIERIEIVRGPMSTLYGADATGGIINIITKKTVEGKPQIDFGIRYGQNSDGNDENKNINLSVRGKEKKLGYSFYINKTKTEPYTQKETADVYAKTSTGKSKPSSYPGALNSSLSSSIEDSYTTDVTYKEESDILTYGGQVEYDFSDYISVGLEFNKFTEERSGTYIGYYHPSNFTMGSTTNQIAIYNAPVNTDDENEKLDTGVNINLNVSNDLIINLKAYKSYYEKRNTTTAKYWEDMGYSSEAESAQNGMNANVDIVTYEAIANYFLNTNHLLTAGVEKRDEEREATVFAQSSDLSSKEVEYKALYLQDEWSIDESFNTIFGLRHDSISNSDSETTFKIGAIKRFSEEFNTRFNIAQGYRTPDIRELYIYKNTAAGVLRGADTIDSSLGKTSYDLKPESTLTYEIGLAGQFNDTKYDFVIFYNDIENLIDEVNKGTYYTYENISKANTYGLEFGINQYISKNLSIDFNWNELRTENEETNKELEFNPDRVLSSGFSYKISKDLDTSMLAKYIGEQYYLKTINRGTPSEDTVDSTTNTYTTLDWNLSYNYSKNLNLYGGINNLTDKTIDDVLGSSSGRYYFAGLKASF